MENQSKTKKAITSLRRYLIDTKYSFQEYFSKFSPIVLAVVSIGVIIGWLFDIDQLKSGIDGEVTMKFSTAIGILLLYVSIILKDKYKSIFTSGILLGLITAIIMSWGVGDPVCFIKSFEDDPVKSLHNDLPSVGTLSLFILSSVSFILKGIPKYIIKYTIIGLSSAALVGYAIDIGWMYFYLDKYSTAMAFHTAICLLHFGAWIPTETNKNECKKYLFSVRSVLQKYYEKGLDMLTPHSISK